MCGLAGVVNLDGAPVTEQEDGAFLRRAANALAHRGPDDQQLVLTGSVGLMFRRLSIVDLAGGRQPITSEDGSITLVANGEIYNHRDLRRSLRDEHRFASDSDCEALVHLYEERGDRFLDDVNGMFGLALLDTRRRVLLLARDRLGVKPLYWARAGRKLVFASEVKALLQHPDVPRSLDFAAALAEQEHLTLPLQGRPLTSFFKGIEQLPAAHVLRIDLQTGEVALARTWDPEMAAEPLRAELADAPAEAFVERYRDLLTESVNMQLMADVECGLFLSGGIDSVSIAALAARSSKLHTFSVLSYSTLGNGDVRAAHESAAAFGLPNHPALFDFRQRIIDPAGWKRILWATETPLASAEMIYKYQLHTFAKALRPELKVMLLGQGSDELNGGYSNVWCQMAPDQQPGWSTLQNVFSRKATNAYLHQARIPAADVLVGDDDRAIVTPGFLAAAAGSTPFARPFDAYRGLYMRSLQMYNLWHEDRTSAAHAVENRVPFLDHRIVELSYAVPPRLFEELFWDKAILRRAMQGIVPEPLRMRAKTPFFYGDDVRYTRRMLHDLLLADDGALIEEAVSAAPDVLDGDALRDLVHKEKDDPELRYTESLLRAVNMGLLQAMARGAVPTTEPGIRVAEITISDWARDGEPLHVDLVGRAPTLSPASTVGFAPGVLITHCTGGDSDFAQPGATYVIMNDRLAFVIEPELGEWLAFLAHVDGERTVGATLEHAAVPASAVWKHLEEALDFGVLRLV